LSLLHREARPLSRDRVQVQYRDDRLFLIGCDDRYAPVQYFEFLEIPRVRIVVDPTLDTKSAPQHVLRRLIEKRNTMKLDVDDECWLVLDTDHNVQTGHIANFVQTIQEARAQGIQVALSYPCFELWLLMHHATEAEATGLSICGEIQDLIRSKAGSYNKTKLRREHYGNGSAAEAILRAERLDALVRGGDIPESPKTRVYQLLRAIVAKSLPSQLPPELRAVR
jgi:hypothetical protein